MQFKQFTCFERMTKRHGALTEGYLDAAEVNAACLR